MTTLRQIAANRANAAQSTGPRTEAGKAASRANALKHGLAGEGVVLPDEQKAAVNERVAQWNSSVRPHEAVDCWLLEMVAVESVRVERCRDQEAEARARLARRAGVCWDADRRLDAERLAVGLGRRPEVVARQLRQTAQGAELLIERWEEMGHALTAGGDWDDGRRALALDLLGVPRAHRGGPTRLDPPDGVGRADWLRRVVAEQVAGLRDEAPGLDDLDGRPQASAMLGDGPPDAELSLLRRYEAACVRRLDWAFGLIRSRRRSAPPMPTPPAYYARPITPVVAYDGEPSEVSPGRRLADAGHDAPAPSPAPTPRPTPPRPPRVPAPRPNDRPRRRRASGPPAARPALC